MRVRAACSGAKGRELQHNAGPGRPHHDGHHARTHPVGVQKRHQGVDLVGRVGAGAGEHCRTGWARQAQQGMMGDRCVCARSRPCGRQPTPRTVHVHVGGTSVPQVGDAAGRVVIGAAEGAPAQRPAGQETASSTGERVASLRPRQRARTAPHPPCAHDAEVDASLAGEACSGIQGGMQRQRSATGRSVVPPRAHSGPGTHSWLSRSPGGRKCPHRTWRAPRPQQRRSGMRASARQDEGEVCGVSTSRKRRSSGPAQCARGVVDGRSQRQA